MPVFDFSGASDKKTGVQSECTYTTFQSNEKETSPEKPIMILDNSSRQWKHHSCGIFTNPIKRTSFEFKEDDGVFSADIISIDSRFVSLLKWLGENHINVRLSGENKENGYAVYKIRETAFGGGTKLSAEDGFLQFMIERLLASSAPAEIVEDEDEEETGDEMKLTSIQSITDFMTCAGRTLPDNIRLWARRNLAVARSHEVSPEERRHAQRALSIMMNVQWKSNYFEAIDPQEARRILDEEADVKKKVMSMFTDPNHLRVEDPGRVEGNPVFIYLDAFCKPEYFAEFLPEYQNLDELKAHYTRGGLGDVKVKKFLNKVLQAELSPIRERRKYWEQHLDDVYDILKEGSKVAEAKAAQTLHDVRSAMQINYFDDNSLIK